MDEVLTHQQWKADKKKLTLTAPKLNQDVGKTLDSYHKDKTLKGSLASLRKLTDGLNAYLDANEGNAKAEKYLKDLIKNTKEVATELKRRGLEAPEMAETLKAIEEKIRTIKIEHVWNDPTLKEMLREQLKEEHSLENINFLEAVEKRKGAWIYEQWVADDCAQNQINLKGATFKDLAEQYKSDRNKMTYRDAYDEILALIGKDALSRLKKTSDFKREIGERMKLL